MKKHFWMEKKEVRNLAKQTKGKTTACPNKPSKANKREDKLERLEDWMMGISCSLARPTMLDRSLAQGWRLKSSNVGKNRAEERCGGRSRMGVGGARRCQLVASCGGSEGRCHTTEQRRSCHWPQWEKKRNNPRTKINRWKYKKKGREKKPTGIVGEKEVGVNRGGLVAQGIGVEAAGWLF